MARTKPDPSIVQEIAHASFRITTPGGRSGRVEAALIANGIAGPVLGEMFDAYSTAVCVEVDRIAAETRRTNR